MIISVCIPTFNRSSELDRTLSVLVSQIELLSPSAAIGIEVLIGDNASSDETSSIARYYVNRYQYFRYFRRYKNLGCERNWMQLVEDARGDFCWILSDDDYLYSNSIFNILCAIKKQPDVIFLSYQVISKDLLLEKGKNLQALVDHEEPRVTLGLGSSSFFEHTLFRSSFISSNVFKTELMLSKKDAVINSITFPYVQLSVAKLLLNEIGIWVSIEEPVLCMRSPLILESRMSALKQGHKHFYLDSWLMYASFVDDQAIAVSIKKKILSELFWQILYEKYCLFVLCPREDRLDYWLSVNSRARKICYYSKSPTYYIALLPLMILPSRVVSVIYLLRVNIIPSVIGLVKTKLWDVSTRWRGV